METNLRDIIQNPNQRVAILDKVTKASYFKFHHLTIGKPPTFGASGTGVTWISSQSSRQLSGSSGRGSAAARRALIRKKRRVARKPLINTHWFTGIVWVELLFRYVIEINQCIASKRDEENGPSRKTRNNCSVVGRLLERYRTRNFCRSYRTFVQRGRFLPTQSGQ